MTNRIVRTLCALALLAAFSLPAIAKTPKENWDFILTVPVKITDLASTVWHTVGISCTVSTDDAKTVGAHYQEFDVDSSGNFNSKVFVKFNADQFGAKYLNKASKYYCHLNFRDAKTKVTLQSPPPNTSATLKVNGSLNP